MTTAQSQQIACQQVLVEDNSVFSIQWIELPSELAAGLTPDDVLRRYTAAIRRMTLGLIQPVTGPEGVAFSLLGRLPLLCFLPPEPDATGLALRIREEGLSVIGFGEEKTPDAFRNACHKFIFTEVLRPSVAEPVTAPPKVETALAKTVTPATPAPVVNSKPEFPKKFVLDALEQSSDENGWAHLGTFGGYLSKLQSDFDSRLYGYKKLSDLVKARTDLFVTEERTAPGQTMKNLYLRAK